MERKQKPENFRNDQDPGLRQRYKALVDRCNPGSPILADCIRAFWVGGLICIIGQGISMLGENVLQLTEDQLSAFTSITMVFLAALLTGLGIYDRIGCYAGAGSAVPITGFANSVVSPAMEFRSEGVIMGTGAKIFTIAGPVLVHGLITSMIIALIRMFI